MDEALVDYYLKELARLEEDCAEFAQAHPQIAERLALGGSGTSDPHVRQLIEATAFIAARLKRHMDGLSGEIVYALLQILCPHLVRPIPSMAIARFAHARQGLDMIPTPLSRGATIDADVGLNKRCTFSVAAGGETLWPLLARAFWAEDAVDYHARGSVVSGDENLFVIRVAASEGSIPVRDPQRLRFYVSGPLNGALGAIENLAFGLRAIFIASPDGSWKVRLPNDALRIIGFNPEDRLIPTESNAEHIGHTLLEYMAFPQRFCFFQIDGLVRPARCKSFDIQLLLDRRAVPSIDAAKNNIFLNCVPLINLYQRNTVPLKLDPLRCNSDCRIPSDRNRKSAWDVYTVNRVRVIRPQGEVSVPQYFTSLDSVDQDALFWVEGRKERVGDCLSSATSVLSFVDESRRPKGGLVGLGDVALIDLSCTDCHTAEALVAGQALDATGLFSHYQASLEATASRYVEPIISQAANVGGLLAAFSFRSVEKNPHLAAKAMLKHYLKAHNRVGGVFADAQVDALRDVIRTLIAVPPQRTTQGREADGGSRYDLYFNDNSDAIPGKYFLGKLSKAILRQISHLSSFDEVWVNDGAWGSVEV